MRPARDNPLKGHVSLDDLRIFALVVQLGSFSAVAKSLGVAPSSICRHMTELQWQLDAKLIEVDTRKVLITRLGMEVYEHCVRMIEAANAACAVIDSLRSNHPRGYFLVSPAETGPITAHQIRQILREELHAIEQGRQAIAKHRAAQPQPCDPS